MLAANTVNLDNLTLTTDQDKALTAFFNFILDPVESVFVLSGYSGCGKSTLVRMLLDRMPDFIRTAKLLHPQFTEYVIELTATTNKAAENLSQITGYPARTIHSMLGLRVSTDYRTGVTTLIPRNHDKQANLLLFIDEASYIDSELLGFIFARTERCKIVFIGDPAQLAPVKSSSTPVFETGFSGAALTQVVRQAEGNPIVDLSTKFRHTVTSGEFFSFTPDGHHVKYLLRDDFNQVILDEFTRPDWRFSDSKVLAWTNKCVVGYNNFVRSHLKGDPAFQVGDYAISNAFVNIGRQSIKTDQMVHISGISEPLERYGVMGHDFTLDHSVVAFMPLSLADKKARLNQAKKNEEHTIAAYIEEQWVDLRAAFACTVNKAQGSTFDQVFIDLDDIRRCNSGDQIARMLYVAVSRARNHVTLTGDLA